MSKAVLLLILMGSLLIESDRKASDNDFPFISCKNASQLLTRLPQQTRFNVLGKISRQVRVYSRADLEKEAYFCQFNYLHNHRHTKAFLDDLRNYITNSSNPTFIEFFTRAGIAFKGAYEEWPSMDKQKEMYLNFLAISREDLYQSIVPVAIAIFLLRYLLTIFILTPLTKELALPEKDGQKLISSSWTAIAYILLWTQSLYVVILSGKREFFEPLTVLDKVRYDIGFFTDQFPGEYFWQYIFQIGFYISSLLNLLYLDRWREDKLVLSVHHMITILLLVFSYSTRFHVIGSITLFLHDINDIFLELGKINVYLKFKHGKYNPINDYLATVCYVLFMASWALTRLYWFPIKVLYSVTWGAYITHIGRELLFFFEFNFLLWSLFVMHIYWSYLIANLAFKILTGQMTNLGDIRETDHEIKADPREYLKTINKNKKKKKRQ